MVGGCVHEQVQQTSTCWLDGNWIELCGWLPLDDVQMTCHWREAQPLPLGSPPGVHAAKAQPPKVEHAG